MGSFLFLCFFFYSSHWVECICAVELWTRVKAAFFYSPNVCMCTRDSRRLFFSISLAQNKTEMSNKFVRANSVMDDVSTFHCYFISFRCTFSLSLYFRLNFWFCYNMLFGFAIFGFRLICVSE